MIFRRHAAFAVIIVLFQAIRVVQSQQNPSYTSTPIFDAGAKDVGLHRQDVCNRRDAYFQGERQLRDALVGFELHPFIRVGEYFHLQEDGSIDPENPGLVALIFDELAKRALFSWRNSFAVNYGPLKDNEGKDLDEVHTWGELLEWGTEVYDLHGDWWIETVDRLRGATSFPEGWIDSSSILVGLKQEESDGDKPDLWNWLDPFHRDVWIAIGITVVLSGLVYSLLEVLGRNPEKSSDEIDCRSTEEKDKQFQGCQVEQDIFLSALAFTQHFQFSPQTRWARLYTASLSFWSLIVVATYTANLTSFFVVENTPTNSIQGMDDVVKAALPICTWTDTAEDVRLKELFPQGIFVGKDKEKELLHGVAKGECAVAVVSRSTWDRYEGNRNINSGCNLEWIGRTVEVSSAGFAVKADACNKCSSLIHDVLHIHLKEMKADGFLEKVWKEDLRRSQDIDCKVMASSLEEDETATLTFDAMAGTFFFHGLVTIVAIIFAAVSSCRNRQRVIMKPRFGREASDNNIDSIAPIPSLHIQDSVQQSISMMMDMQMELKTEMVSVMTMHQEMKNEMKDEMNKLRKDLKEAKLEGNRNFPMKREETNIASRNRTRDSADSFDDRQPRILCRKCSCPT